MNSIISAHCGIALAKHRCAEASPQGALRQNLFFRDNICLTCAPPDVHCKGESNDSQWHSKAYAAPSIGLLASPSFGPELDNYVAMATTSDVLSDVLAASYQLGGQKHLPSLLNLLMTADEDDVWGILNSTQDLTERRYPPTLLADAPQIREALTATEQRNALYHGQIKQILDNLRRLER